MSAEGADGRAVWGAVAAALREGGVEFAFGLPGDDLVVVEAFAEHGLEVVLYADQRHAVYAATACAVATGVPAACFVGKGPAVTHALSGVLEADAQRAPVVLLTSGVPEVALGSGAFQELDTVAVVAPLVKRARRVALSADIADHVRRALAVAGAAPAGPVLLEIPEGLPEASPSVPVEPAGRPPEVRVPDLVVLGDTVLDGARRPLLIVGGGCRHADVGRSVVELAELTGAGILCTASGRGVVDEHHPAFLGLVGLYAHDAARAALAASDVVLVLGSRLEETALHEWPSPSPAVVQVNHAPSDVVAHLPGEIVVADVRPVVAGLLRRAWGSADPTWRTEVRSLAAAARADRSAAVDRAAADPAAVPGPARTVDVLRLVDAVVPARRWSVHENGLHDMRSYFWPDWTVGADADCLVPSEQTPMGFGVVAAGAVARCLPGSSVVAVVGDGAFRSAAVDLARLRGEGSSVLVVVLADGGLGWLEANRRQSAPTAPSFLSASRPVGDLCRADGVPHVRASGAVDLEAAVREAWQQAVVSGVAVLEVETSSDDVPPGFEVLAGDFPLVAGQGA